MTKEQLQTALNEATARIDEQKAKIADLETENAKLKEDLLDAIPATASATFAADKDRITELEVENAKLAAALKEAGDPADKGRIGILLGAISQSCADHCPHHMDESACPNCGIYKSVFNAGYKISRPEPAQEV